MLDKLDSVKQKYEDLGQIISDPEVVNDQNRWRKLVKEHASLEPIVAKFKEYNSVKEDYDEAREIIQDRGADEELKEMAKDEIKELEEQKEALEEELKMMLIPKDPNDDKNVIVEIRAGAGGDEAAIFAGDLFRMYTRFSERQGWKVEILNLSESETGGYKEVVFMVKGDQAYSLMKYESGGHRVQRVPETESSGRIHTSAATVAVLPEVDDVELEIDPNDLRVDVFRASGHGGQSVNTTDSAVRITHLPTGVVASCQDEKSQMKNKDKALKVLKARVLDQMVKKQEDEIAADRKSQVGSGDRSDRIRTYNYPQGRITDHRINKTIYKLDAFMDGDIYEMIDGLRTSEQAEKLKEIQD
jgi:peptide chain release factor 1